MPLYIQLLNVMFCHCGIQCLKNRVPTLSRLFLRNNSSLFQPQPKPHQPQQPDPTFNQTKNMSTQPPHPKPPLPTPRTLLTTLLNAISTIPLLPAPTTSHPSKPTTNPSPDSSNPLRRVPPSHRHLITTLHVLFPGLLLPALDLLERGLVARISLFSPNNSRSTSTGARPGPGPDFEPDTDPSAATHPNANGKKEDQVRKSSFYLVTSASAAAAAAEKRRRGRGGGGDGEIGEEGSGVGGTGGYVVRLGAWQCSCAAFAFAAAVQGEVGGGGMMVRSTREEEVRAEGWSFGGDSLDGLRAGEGVPVCKHLMACLLAERWSAALGRYVVERRVGREEMAGIVADV